jgi:hypothetical protein
LVLRVRLALLVGIQLSHLALRQYLPLQVAGAVLGHLVLLVAPVERQLEEL